MKQQIRHDVIRVASAGAILLGMIAFSAYQVGIMARKMAERAVASVAR